MRTFNINGRAARLDTSPDMRLLPALRHVALTSAARTATEQRIRKPPVAEQLSDA
ncbi:MAG: hypothetical protein ABI612_10380 [Betaproteobacteria bacterium]